ncbi:hypothetical protein B9Z19DRAFT_962633, partial [Tuber borchii]
RTIISKGTSLKSSTITLLDSRNTVAGNASILAKLDLDSTCPECSFFAKYALLRLYFGGNASREMKGNGKRMSLVPSSTDWGSFFDLSSKERTLIISYGYIHRFSCK